MSSGTPHTVPLKIIFYLCFTQLLFWHWGLHIPGHTHSDYTQLKQTTQFTQSRCDCRHVAVPSCCGWQNLYLARWRRSSTASYHASRLWSPSSCWQVCLPPGALSGSQGSYTKRNVDRSHSLILDLEWLMLLFSWIVHVYLSSETYKWAYQVFDKGKSSVDWALLVSNLKVDICNLFILLYYTVFLIVVCSDKF